jgi:hypothetical protein
MDFVDPSKKSVVSSWLDISGPALSDQERKEITEAFQNLIRYSGINLTDVVMGTDIR